MAKRTTKMAEDAINGTDEVKKVDENPDKTKPFTKLEDYLPPQSRTARLRASRPALRGYMSRDISQTDDVGYRPTWKIIRDILSGKPDRFKGDLAPSDYMFPDGKVPEGFEPIDKQDTDWDDITRMANETKQIVEKAKSKVKASKKAFAEEQAAKKAAQTSEKPPVSDAKS